MWLVVRRADRQHAYRDEDVARTYLVISAYNEERVIAEKVRNSLGLAPPDLTVVVISDGSTDGTDIRVSALASRQPRLRLIRVEGRRGKNHALNIALDSLAPSPDSVVVFSDANAIYEQDAVEKLVDALRLGASCAIGRVQFVDANSGTARSEGIYWQYENSIKLGESALGRVLVANGAIFAVRAGDVPPLPEDIGNDFWIPLLLIGQGKAVRYVPEAVAYELAPQRSDEEFRRKVRMANRSMRGVRAAWSRIDSLTKAQLMSHKVFRWLGLPVYVFTMSCAIALASRSPIFTAVSILFVVPILCAASEPVLSRLGFRTRIGEISYHFFLVHIAAFIGVVEAFTGRRRASWKPVSSARTLSRGNP